MTEWLPAGFGLAPVLLLLTASFLGSLMTATLGVGGGAFMLIVMAEFIPPLALIPLHGVVQLGSNAGRAWRTRAHVDWRIVLPFAVGALLAAVMAIVVVTIAVADQLKLEWIPLAVACFILWLCWGPLPSLSLVQSPLATAAGGLLTTLATMVFGATGPLVSAWLGRSFGDKWTYTACFSACMSLQHSLKILVFGWLGFNFAPWVLLTLLMILAGYAGTRLGLRLLHRLPEQQFQRIFRLLLTALALRIIWRWALAV